MTGLAAFHLMRRKASFDGSSVGAADISSGAQSVHPFIDAFDRRRQPNAKELLRELKNTAWACVNINASVAAGFPPIAYLKTSPGLPVPKADLVDICPMLRKSLLTYPWWKTVTKASKDQFALPAHPINDLFTRGNYFHRGYDLWYLTHQYMEIFGICFWWVVRDEWTGLPMEIRVISPVECEPRWENWNEPDPWEAMKPTYYRITLFGQHRTPQFDLPPDAIVEFRRPDPASPRRGGRSPLQACFELVKLQSEYIAHRQALYANRARPDVVISPATGEFINPDEMERMKRQWNQEYRRGGAGQPHFAQIPLNVAILGWVESQVQLLGEHGVTKEDICNVMGVPIAFYTRDVNNSNILGSQTLHRGNTIQPIIYSRDETITYRICTLYDPSGMLFVSAEDPVPEDQNAKTQRQEADLKSGLRSINQVRAENGWPPVEWGETPWLPTYFAPVDMNLVWEVRRDMRLSQNDPAFALDSARTRGRPEDVNARRPMKTYAHTDVHGNPGEAARRGREQEKAHENNGVKKKAMDLEFANLELANLIGERMEITQKKSDLNLEKTIAHLEKAVGAIGAQKPGDIHIQVTDKSIDSLEQALAALKEAMVKMGEQAVPVVNVTTPEPTINVHVDAPEIPTINLPEPKVIFQPQQPRKRKAKWKDEDGKSHEIEIE